MGEVEYAQKNITEKSLPERQTIARFTGKSEMEFNILASPHSSGVNTYLYLFGILSISSSLKEMAIVEVTVSQLAQKEEDSIECKYAPSGVKTG